MLDGMNEALPIDPAAATALAPDAPPAGIGVLLVNLGTPDAADAPAVRRYLKEFLSDPRVIENQGVVWQLVLNGVILPIRPRIKAKDYQKIWNVERNESPLKTITRAQAEKLAAALRSDSRLVVDWAMRYGNPSIASRLAGLIARGCERILVIPLYPQYSAATTATVCDEVFRVLTGLRRQPTVRFAAPYYDDEVYIGALASSMRDELGKLPFQPEVILASYHGMPEEYVRKGDPYEKHCIETTRLLRERLGMDETKLMLTFQSRFGRAKWLGPATDETVKALAKRGVKSLAVVTPGFSADCLETLEEIAVENAHIFKKHGGENFAALPCLNDSAPGMLLLEDMALRELKGWV
jgi:protoporphyrin/coproporphyrin ferrochelatase